MEELNSLKNILTKITNLKEKIEANLEIINLLKIDADLELKQLLEEEIDIISNDIYDLENKLLLNGEYDKCDTILEIHPGAGGGTSGGTGDNVYANGITGNGCPGGTQTSGFAFGQGGSIPQSSWDWYAISYTPSGGGGGGWYGGQGNCGITGSGTLEKTGDGGGGGGGSGYIGGVTGGSMSSGQREGDGYARITLVSY